jgi:pyridoxamine 5'-phosphate oxidase
MPSIADIRRDYRSRALSEDEVAAEPIAQFRQWFDEAVRADLLDVNAMTLATADAHGRPDARIVLLKDVGPDGFVFFTNYESTKGQQLAANPRACLLFFWAELERQVRVTGHVTLVSRDDSEAYFRSRPFESRLGAWASQQSAVLPSRQAIEQRFRDLQEQYEGRDVPLPPYWGGYRVMPEEVEFWQGRPSRLHDRLRYSRQGEAWGLARLSP